VNAHLANAATIGSASVSASGATTAYGSEAGGTTGGSVAGDLCISLDEFLKQPRSPLKCKVNSYLCILIYCTSSVSVTL
jgi:hypothetical protein